MRATDPAYAPADYPVTYTLPMTGHLGYQIDIPHMAPVSTPFYFGENPVIGRRELVTQPQGEYFAVDNIIPMLTDKIPLVDLSDPAYAFSRVKHSSPTHSSPTLIM